MSSGLIMMELKPKLSLSMFKSIPEAICPSCGFEMNDGEIIEGFLNNHFDTTTQCINCLKRYEASLIIYENGTKFKVPYICKDQTLYSLKSMQKYRRRIGERFLYKNSKGLYYNVIRYFGTYHNGMEALKNF